MSETKKIRAGDIDIAYRLEGAEQAPVVLLAHGILTTHRMWDALAQALAPRWRMLRYDLRGHGGTSATEPPYTMLRLARDAVELLDALGIERAHFIGSSLGGMIGQRLGSDFGHRLHSLTLANTTSRQGMAQAWQDRISTAHEKGVAPLVEPTLQRWFTEDFLAQDPEPVPRMRELALSTGVPGFTGCAAAVRDLAHADLLPSIRVPTLVVAGEQDRATPAAESEFLQQQIPGARLVRLPAAHQSAVECPDAFAQAWEAFARPLS
jgi:3-oxoadipate enol-lactonase